MAFLRDFKLFIREYRIIALSIAFIISIAASNFVQSFVNDVLLPVIRPLISSTTWEAAILPIGSVNIRIGSFLSAFLNLLIIAILLYILIYKILKWKPSR